MSIRCARFLLALPLLGSSVLAAQSADLFVTKSGPATATVGANVTYTISIGNNGPDDSANATVTDTLPAGASFVSASQSTGPSFSCSTPSVGAFGGTVTCSIATFPAGGAADFQVVLNVGAGAAGTTLINSAAVSSGTADDNVENDTSIVGTDVAGGNLADVGVAKSGPLAAAPGSNVTFTISVADLGPNDANNVVLSDTLGAGLTFVSLTQTSGPPFTCPGGTMPCSLGTLPYGSVATFDLVAATPGTSGTYGNTVSVVSANDPNPDNDTATASVLVASADVGVVKSAPATAISGGTLLYTFTVSNSGPDPAEGVLVNDPLPPGTTFLSLTQTSGPTASCTTPSQGAAGAVACGIGLLLNGQSATIEVLVTVDPLVANGTSLVNTATVSSTSSDPNANDNSSSASTTALAQADVSVTKIAPPTGLAGASVSYTITVANAGPSSAASFTLSDTLPAGTSFVSLVQTAGPTLSCAVTAVVTCSIAALPPGSSATFGLTLGVSGSFTGLLSNTAAVSSTTPDPNPGNETSTVSTAISASADLSLLKTAPATAAAGSQLAYTIVLANAGPSTAANVSFADTLPAPLTFVSVNQTSGPAFSCSGTATVTCSAASLDPGASATFTLVAAIPAGFTGPVSNTATATTTTTDPVPGNNTSLAATTVQILVGGAIPTLPPSLMVALGGALAGAGWWALRRLS